MKYSVGLRGFDLRNLDRLLLQIDQYVVRHFPVRDELLLHETVAVYLIHRRRVDDRFVLMSGVRRLRHVVLQTARVAVHVRLGSTVPIPRGTRVRFRRRTGTRTLTFGLADVFPNVGT